jgi:hypothetical protein
MNERLGNKSTPPQPPTDLRDYQRSPQFPNHWIAAVSGLKFFRETSFARFIKHVEMVFGGYWLPGKRK